MQAEIIPSLKLVAIHDSALCSIISPRKTSVLSQRKSPRTMIRPLNLEPASLEIRTLEKAMQASPYEQTCFIPNDFIAASVALPTPEEANFPKHSLAEILSQEHKDSPTNVSSPSTSAQGTNTRCSETVERFNQARSSKDWRAAIEDADVMTSCDDRSTSQTSHGLWNYAGNRDTFTWLAGDDSYKQDPLLLNAVRSFETRPLPPTPEDSQSYQEQPRHQQPARSPLSHLPAQAPRWSNGSEYSDPTCTKRNSATSSHSSCPRSPQSSFCIPQFSVHDDDLRLFNPSITPYQECRQKSSSYHGIQSLPSHAFVPALSPQSPRQIEDQPSVNSVPTLRLSTLSDAHQNASDKSLSPTHMPWLCQSNSFPTVTPRPPPPPNSALVSQENEVTKTKSSRSRYKLIPSVGRKPLSLLSSESGGSLKGPALEAGPRCPAVPSPRPSSSAASISSSSSSITGRIGILPRSRLRNSLILTDAIQSGCVSEKQTLEGRPCKENNYWGFCKGAWTICSDVKKGISIRTQPSGYYNQKQVWECTSCTFQGDSFMKPHATKKNKMEPVVDPRIHVSRSGIRYRWIFLAKAHVKRKASDGAEGRKEEASFCCMFCTTEGVMSSVHRGAEALMDHISLSHVADVNSLTLKKTNCIIGRTAAATEAFDINIPIFAERSEAMPIL